MMEKIYPKFYTVDRCGYYKYNDKKNYLTNISDILDDMQDWIKDKIIEKTLTTNKSNVKTQRLIVYCLNVTKCDKHNTYLVTTWNKVETTDGNVLSIKINEPAETASKNVNTAKLPKNSIPGYATYSYIIPDDNILATVKFNHISNGHIGLNSYMNGFLTYYSKYVQTDKKSKTKDSAKIEVIGYGNSDTDFNTSLNPYFKSRLKKNKINTDKILANVNSISKIIRKTTISTDITAEKSLYGKLMEKLGTKATKDNKEFQLKYEMKINPTKENTQEIIKSWNKKDSWDDIGFQIKCEDNPVWLSADVHSQDLSISINRINSEFVDFNDLIAKLNNNLSKLRKSYK